MSWELDVRESVRQTLADYTAATDRFDLHALASCFDAAGVLEFTGGAEPLTGPGEHRGGSRRRHVRATGSSEAGADPRSAPRVEYPVRRGCMKIGSRSAAISPSTPTSGSTTGADTGTYSIPVDGRLAVRAPANRRGRFLGQQPDESSVNAASGGDELLRERLSPLDVLGPVVADGSDG